MARDQALELAIEAFRSYPSADNLDSIIERYFATVAPNQRAVELQQLASTIERLETAATETDSAAAPDRAASQEPTAPEPDRPVPPAPQSPAGEDPSESGNEDATTAVGQHQPETASPESDEESPSEEEPPTADPAPPANGEAGRPESESEFEDEGDEMPTHPPQAEHSPRGQDSIDADDPSIADAFQPLDRPIDDFLIPRHPTPEAQPPPSGRTGRPARSPQDLQDPSAPAPSSAPVTNRKDKIFAMAKYKELRAKFPVDLRPSPTFSASDFLDAVAEQLIIAQAPEGGANALIELLSYGFSIKAFQNLAFWTSKYRDSNDKTRLLDTTLPRAGPSINIVEFQNLLHAIHFSAHIARDAVRYTLLDIISLCQQSQHYDLLMQALGSDDNTWATWAEQSEVYRGRTRHSVANDVMNVLSQFVLGRNATPEQVKQEKGKLTRAFKKGHGLGLLGTVFGQGYWAMFLGSNKKLQTLLVNITPRLLSRILFSVVRQPRFHAITYLYAPLQEMLLVPVLHGEQLRTFEFEQIAWGSREASTIPEIGQLLGPALTSFALDVGGQDEDEDDFLIQSIPGIPGAAADVDMSGEEEDEAGAGQDEDEDADAVESITGNPGAAADVDMSAEEEDEAGPVDDDGDVFMDTPDGFDMDAAGEAGH